MSINDVNGFPLGRNAYGKPINLDIWSRYSNNIMVLGSTGAGKTVAVKHTILHQFYRGVKVVVIDLYREYKDLCKALGGYWIDGDSDYIDCPRELLSASFIVIDLYDLKGANKELKASHYDKVLSWCWARMTQSIDERVLLVVDDIKHFDIEPVHDRLVHMHTSCRLRNCGMLLVSTESDDLTREMAYNSTYIIVMCVGSSKKIDDVVYSCNFSEADLSFLAQHKKWTALLTASGDTEQVNIVIPNDEKTLVLGKRRFIF